VAKGHLWRIVQTRPHLRTIKDYASPSLSQKSRLRMIHLDNEAQYKKHNHKHSSSCFSHNCLMTRGNTKGSSYSESDSSSDRDDEKTL
jgi:hypothetical protein